MFLGGLFLDEKKDFNSKYEISSSLNDLTALRKEYEKIRPRLLFLAKNNPDSEEYKELYYYAKDIMKRFEELTDNNKNSQL